MDFEIGFTDKDITPWGGMALMKKMLDHCDIDSMFSTLGLPDQVPTADINRKTSSRAFWSACGVGQIVSCIQKLPGKMP